MTVKCDALTATPFAVVTVIGPVPAPKGRVAVIWDSESTENEAGTPLNATEETPAKFNPVSVTVVSAGPKAGLKVLRVGASRL